MNMAAMVVTVVTQWCWMCVMHAYGVSCYMCLLVRLYHLAWKLCKSSHVFLLLSDMRMHYEIRPAVMARSRLYLPLTDSHWG